MCGYMLSIFDEFFVKKKKKKKCAALRFSLKAFFLKLFDVYLLMTKR